jgi:8-oxo-dGTP pyrophosphatase MutT (NUDIX family)
MTPQFQKFIQQITRQFEQPLPGKEAQLKMASLRRFLKMSHFHPRANAIPSGVLILFYPYREDISMVLILRPNYKGAHSGQISLPGGKSEPSDASPEETALREAREEIGINPAGIVILGRLTPLYIPPSNYLVIPIVGYSKHQPQFKPDPQEVDQIIEIRLKDLLDENNIKTERFRIWFGFSIEAPCFSINGHKIWGATAMILSELIEMVRLFENDIP